MSKDAYIELNCGRYSDKISEFIELMYLSGWKHFDKNGNTTLVPLGSNDYEWTEIKINVEDLKMLIEKKQSEHEKICVTFFYEDTDVGITLIANNTSEIMLNLNINRRTIVNDITDIGWYFSTIIVELKKRECFIDSIKFEEY